MQNKQISDIPAYARLYYISKKDSLASNKGKENNSFIPNIDKKSKKLERNEKVEDILYKDAQRRQAKSKEFQQKSRSYSEQKVKLSNNSENVLIYKFQREFLQVLHDLQLESTEFIELSSVLEILIKLGFIKYYQQTNGPLMQNEKKLIFLLWQLLGGEKHQKIYLYNMRLFLQCILGLGLNSTTENINNNIQQEETNTTCTNNENISQILKTNKSSGMQKNNKSMKLLLDINDEIQNVTLGQFFNEGKNWILDSEDKKFIRITFEPFYRNRLAYEQLRNNKFNWEQSFTIQVSPYNNYLANQKRQKIIAQAQQMLQQNNIAIKLPENGKIQLQQLLMLQKITQQQEIIKKKQEQDAKEMQQCSFKPEFTYYKGNFNNQKVKKQNYQQKNDFYFPYSNQKPEEILEECTFFPDTSKPKIINKQEIFAKNIDKSIDRIRNAYSEKEIINEMLQKGKTRDQILKEKQKNISQSQKNNNRKQTCSSLEKNNYKNNSYYQYMTQDNQVLEEENEDEEDKNEKIPLLFVDVNLGQGITKRIIVYEGDRSDELANKFSKEHNLDEITKNKFKQLLDEQIAGLLSKIEEEEMLSFESNIND